MPSLSGRLSLRKRVCAKSFEVCTSLGETHIAQMMSRVTPGAIICLWMEVEAGDLHLGK